MSTFCMHESSKRKSLFSPEILHLDSIRVLSVVVEHEMRDRLIWLSFFEFLWACFTLGPRSSHHCLCHHQHQYDVKYLWRSFKMNIDFRVQSIRLHTMFILLKLWIPSFLSRFAQYFYSRFVGWTVICVYYVLYTDAWLRSPLLHLSDCVKDPNCTKLISHSLTLWADQSLADVKSLLTLC